MPPKRAAYTRAASLIDAVEVLRLCREERLGPAAVARRLGMGWASVYRVLGKHAVVAGTKGGVDAEQA
jgi:hypothetical protein